jgi:hypothetical protein
MFYRELYNEEAKTFWNLPDTSNDYYLRIFTPCSVLCSDVLEEHTGHIFRVIELV